MRCSEDCSSQRRFVHQHEFKRCVHKLPTCAASLRGAYAKRRLAMRDSAELLQDMEEARMPRVKQASKRKRVTKSVPVLGAAGLTFSLVGGASAAVAPAQDQPRTPNLAPGHEITLGEEEISDVSLATFYAFDKENTGSLRGMVQEARACRCGGCRGCRSCRGCRGCSCGYSCGSCCLSWGACRLC